MKKRGQGPNTCPTHSMDTHYMHKQSRDLHMLITLSLKDPLSFYDA